MSLNWTATFALLTSVTFRPRLIVPHVHIRDLRQLDFAALRRAGYDGAVFDKDNCLTLPLEDNLIPELSDAWAACKEAFGPGRVVVVSNSAGTPDDPGGIQAESASHKLGVPVLSHASKKPGWPCVRDVQMYFATHPSGQTPSGTPPLSLPEATKGKLLVVGDRLFTDVVLAHRLAAPSSFMSRSSLPTPPQTLSVFVEPWDPAEARLLRSFENSALRSARRMTSLEGVALPLAKGQEIGGARLMDGVWVVKGREEELRAFVRPWSSEWRKASDELLRERGAATWEGK